LRLLSKKRESSHENAFLPLLWFALAPTFVVRVQDTAAEAALRAIVDEQAAAWNAGDGVAYSQHLALEASFANIFGMVMYGKDAFAKRHVEILTTFFKGTTKKHTVRRIRLLTAVVRSLQLRTSPRPSYSATRFSPQFSSG
jgi:hypothetical protein